MEKSELAQRFRFDDVTMVVPSSVPGRFREYRGREVPLRTDLRRSGIWLTAAQAEVFGVAEPGRLLQPGESPGDEAGKTHLALANFRHAGRHWIAVFPLFGLQTVIVQQQIFRRAPVFRHPLAAHGQIRFLLAEPEAVEMLAQEDGDEPSALDPVDDFVFSAEAVGPRIEGFPDYSLWGGARGWYRQSMRFLSTEEKAAAIFEEGQTVNQYLLDLQEGEAEKIFLEAVRRSHRMGLDESYHTLAIGGTQCAYEMFNILDRAILDSRENPGLGPALWRNFDRLPLFMGRYLKERGLRFAEAKNNRFPTLNAEFAMGEEEAVSLRARLEKLAQG